MRSLLVFLVFSVFVVATAAPGDLKWKCQTEGAVVSSPAIGTDEGIYFGSNDGCFYAVSHLDGHLYWRYQTGGAVRSSPAIGSDDTKYVGSDDSFFYAITSDTFRWRYKTGGAVTSSPAIDPNPGIGNLYVGSYDHNVYAIDAWDGTLKWKYETGGAVASSPMVYEILGSDPLEIGSDDSCYYEIDAFDGDLYKKTDMGNCVRSSPAISLYNRYVGSDDSCLYAFSWEYRTGGRVRSSPAIDTNGTIYVGSDDSYIYAINPDGTLKWRYQTGDTVESSPAVGCDGVVYVGSDDGYLYALNPDGSLQWRYETGGKVRSSPTIARDGTVYVGSNDSCLYAIGSSSEGLANSLWPKFRHDEQNTGGCICGGIEEQPHTLFNLTLNALTISRTIKVSYTLPEGQSGILRVYNVSGQRVAETTIISSGEKEFSQAFPRGVYLVRLETNEGVAQAKAIVL